MTRLLLAAIALVFMVGDAGSAGTGCTARHIAYRGKPPAVGHTVAGLHIVPAGHHWVVSNVSLLAERHSNGTAEAGEFTSILAVGADRVTVAQSSLDAGSGIALQGQGATQVLLEAGTRVEFSVWLRDGKNPENYFYDLSASFKDCR